jgi:hypothetical protein
LNCFAASREVMSSTATSLGSGCTWFAERCAGGAQMQACPQSG